MRYLALLLAAFGLLLVPTTHASPPPDAWADAVYQSSGLGLTNPGNTIGPADGQTTNIAGVQPFITLDMGAGEEGTGSLRVYFGQILVQTDLQVVFLDENLSTITSGNRSLTVSTSTHSQLFNFSFADHNKAYRYVRLSSLADAGFSIDAVEASSYQTSTPAPSCTPRTEICGNSVDEDCNGSDATCAPSTPPPSCQSDTWSCSEWSSCSANGQETRTCTMTSDCPGVATQSPALSRQCIPPSSTTSPPSSSQSQSYYYYYSRTPRLRHRHQANQLPQRQPRQRQDQPHPALQPPQLPQM